MTPAVPVPTTPPSLPTRQTVINWQRHAVGTSQLITVSGLTGLGRGTGRGAGAGDRARGSVSQ